MLHDSGGKREFRWESGYEKTWSAIREDESGRLVTTLEQLIHDAHTQIRKKRRRIGVGSTGFVRLGMMRHLFLIIDLSQAMNEQDLKPNRLICTVKAACTFVREYFDQNPISQLGIIVTSDRRAERLTELSGNPRPHLSALQSLYTRTCIGEPSLQNALLLAESRLKYTIHHNEIVVLMASLTTCDPSDIHQTIKSLSSNRIRCSVISLAVEVFVYRALAQFTQGTFHVIMDELHLKNVLKDLVPPPVAAIETEANLIRMGFPHSETFDLDRFAVKRCMCHLSNKSINDKIDSTTINPHYACPRCYAGYCELPVECNVCGLTLVAAPHLARAYHHLFPLDLFEPVNDNDNFNEISLDNQEKLKETIDSTDNTTDHQPRVCFGCNVMIPLKVPGYQCPKCKFIFCHSCDAVLHDSIHSCPGCLTLL
ncbi:unnamed protein product [Schistosoma margrebowiei]|uniref:General transcription factor IIH subunit n=1 Tax=Schistosoma margrebowiei TaxID=48269 RepID=A0A183MGP3_9TREM|nr:unnamed protein product [Schistosoma margrebowiei]